MPTTAITTVEVNFAGTSPASNGVVTAPASASFSSRIIQAGAAIQSWNVSFGGTDHWFRAGGAWITDLSFLDNKVSFVAKLQLIDKSENKIDPNDVSMAVMVVATIE